jgi:hypothetical protein
MDDVAAAWEDLLKGAMEIAELVGGSCDGYCLFVPQEVAWISMGPPDNHDFYERTDRRTAEDNVCFQLRGKSQVSFSSQS